MRRACRRMWRVVPCTSRKSLRTESWKDIEGLLKCKLATIKEEPELCEDIVTPPRARRMASQGKKMKIKTRIGKLSVPHFSLKDSYSLFISGFASKGSFGGFLQY